MVRKFIFTFLILISNSLILSAQDISASASTDSSSYKVGDYIYYTIKVEYKGPVQIYTPNLKDYTTSVDILDVENPVAQEKGGKKIVLYKFILSKYDSADITIPPIPVTYKVGTNTLTQFVETNAVSFSVRTLKVSIDKDIRDVKGPVKIPLDWKIIAMWVLIAFLIIGLILYFYLKNQQKKALKGKRKKIVYVPPHITALNALYALEKEQLWQRGKIKEYHSRITEIIRRYFEKRFELPALEMSTSEVVDNLNRITIPENIKDITYRFLTNADLVKFAKFIPLNSINEEMMKQAQEIVENTVPDTALKTEGVEHVQ